MAWKRSQTQRLALVIFNLGLVGCYSTSLMQDTRVAPRGKGRVALGGGLARTQDRPRDGFVEAALHLGVAPMLELQAKIGSASVDALRSQSISARDSRSFLSAASS
jgi:hypothetical protein